MSKEVNNKLLALLQRHQWMLEEIITSLENFYDKDLAPMGSLILWKDDSARL